MFEKSKWIQYIIEKDQTAEKHEPVPYIAKTFRLKGKVKKATLNICGYGEAAYFINGEVIPDSFRPTFPSIPSKTIIYNVYDVTSLLKEGNNRIGAMLSRHRCISKSENRMLNYGKVQSLVLQLDIVYTDGEKECIVSDTSFKGAPSYVTFAARTFGEIHHKGKEIKNWCQPEFDDSLWENVSVIPAPGGEYRTTDCPSIRKTEEHKGEEIAPGLYDFGLVTAGHIRAKITGKKDSFIKFDYSERLTEDGLHIDGSAYKREEKEYPDMYNCDGVILSGAKEDVFEDFFSIHGFRYVEVTGEFNSIELVAVTAHTDIKLDSSFRCNNEIINKIHNACTYSIATCCQGYFVDNPKRDAPWVGDQMLSAEAIALNFDCFGTMYENMVLCRDSQTDYGSIPAVVPQTGAWAYQKFLGPDWTDSVIFHVPYFTYKYTGNRKIVDDMWQSMEKALEFFVTLGDGGYLINKNGTGDWSAVKEGCSLEVVMSAYYRIDALMMGELAVSTGREAEKYFTLAEKIKAEYREKYLENGKIKGKHITEYIVPAACGFLNKEEIPAAIDTVIGMIKEDGMAMTFGCHGLRMIFDLLSEYGYEQLVFELLTNDRVLGFAKNVKDGINTLPERFNFGAQPIMSLNHHFFSGVDAWFYKWVSGIKINGFGYDDIVIAPARIDGIDKFETVLHGIKVRRNEDSLYVSCPYVFTYKDIKYSAGEYEFYI